MAQPPNEFPNPRGDDPWDNDAVHWLLTQENVAAEWDRHNLFECARRQPKRLTDDVDRVIEAARICERHGVEQVLIFDPKIGKEIYRLRRTDPDAPAYPELAKDEKHMMITEKDRAAAVRFLTLLREWEQELVAQHKSHNTIHTYVDRTERFLKRVIAG